MHWWLVVIAVVGLAGAGCLEGPSNVWAESVTQLDLVQDSPLPGRSVRVAILDTGIDAAHPSLSHLTDGRVGNGDLVGYVDFLGSSLGPQDAGGHGTFIAGVLAARAPDGLASMTSSSSALHGLAPNLQLLVGRICNVEDCSLIALWHALDWAVKERADIVSLSIGFSSIDLANHSVAVDGIHRALQAAERQGILVVAAAGNTHGGPVLFPAREGSVLAVGAMDRDGRPRASTARGFGSNKPDLVAPGENIVGLHEGGGRVRMDGTSVAVPFVVAAAAYMMARVINPNGQESLSLLRESLRESAAPLAAQRQPHDPWAGHGLLQAQAALDLYRLHMTRADRT